MNRFTDLVGKNKFRDHRQVRRLPEVLDNAKAMEVLESTDMDAAIKTVESSMPPHLKEPLYSLVQSAIEELRNMPRIEISKIRNDPEKMNLIKDLKKEVESVLAEAEGS